MVLVDAYSKWIEVSLMTFTTPSQAIGKLRNLFAAYGFSEKIVSDNGPQLVSQDFEQFLSTNNIKHAKAPPYHPIFNGAAERLVQTTKRALLKQPLSQPESRTKETLQEALDSFLMSYRNTPHSITGKTPAELFLNRQPRVKLSFLKPNFVRDMRDKQLKHKQQKDKHRGAERAFAVGERVYAKCVRGESISWDDGTVTQVVSPVTYLVRMAGGRIRFMHADHMRHAFARPVATEPVSVRVDEARVRRDEQPSLVVPPTQPSDGTSIRAHCSTSADASPTPDDGSAQSSPIHPTTEDR